MKKAVLATLLTGGLFASVITCVFAPAFSVEPLQAGGVTVFDLPKSSVDAINLDIRQGFFSGQSVGHLVLSGKGIDFREGRLNNLAVHVEDGYFAELPVQSLRLSTEPFSFDPFELINHRRFILDKPVNGTVSVKMTEQNLNEYLNNPKTISRLEEAIAKQTGGLRLVSFKNPSLNLLGGNKVALTLDLLLGNALGIPLQMDGELILKEGSLFFDRFQVTSNGSQLPVDIAGPFQKKLNEMVNWRKVSKDRFALNANRLKISKKTVEMDGTASLSQLEFGH